jgi:broad-specificity NMP kinase
MTETDVVIIKGTPCSGKSETAKALSKFFPNGVRIEVDTVRSMVISVNWKNQQEHINMLQIAADMVRDYLEFGFRPIIVVDTFSGDKIKGFLEKLHQLINTLSVKVFVLYVTDEELKHRLEIRPNDKFKDYAICKKQNDDVLNIRFENEILINTTDQTVKKTAENIYNLIQIPIA